MTLSLSNILSHWLVKNRLFASYYSIILEQKLKIYIKFVLCPLRKNTHIFKCVAKKIQYIFLSVQEGCTDISWNRLVESITFQNDFAPSSITPYLYSAVLSAWLIFSPITKIYHSGVTECHDQVRNFKGTMQKWEAPWESRRALYFGCLNGAGQQSSCLPGCVVDEQTVFVGDVGQ